MQLQCENAQFPLGKGLVCPLWATVATWYSIMKGIRDTFHYTLLVVVVSSSLVA